MINTANRSIDVAIMVYKPDKRLYRSINMLKKQKLPVRTIYLYNTVIEPSDVTDLLKNCLRYVTGYADNQTDFGLKLVPVRKDDFGHGRTRQLAVNRSDADYILFLTQDAVVKDEYLTKELVTALDAYDNSAVAYARQLPGKYATETEKFNRYFNYPPGSQHKTKEDIPKLGIKTYFCSDVCAMYRKSVFDALGGFETTVDFNEDMFFAYKAIQQGYSVEYAAGAKVIHYHNNSLKEMFERNRANAISQKHFGMLKEGAESEGLRLIRTAAGYFLRRGMPVVFLRFSLEAAVKYAGFFCGKHFDK